MELTDVTMTLIKILVSVPTIFLLPLQAADGAALMGGHLDNTSNSSTTSTEYLKKEEIPDPSALVLPGYNLPENIFNKGKPFYLEKDPLTGKIDFNSKSSLKLDDELYDYVDEQPNDDIYDKSNIDRKDGSLNGHRPNDVNQLTPNFHDFLNLPVKYNSDKYVYPLISSSYANTKVQGNVNKYHTNHKDYNYMKTSTRKPTYYSASTNQQYFNPNVQTKSTTTSSTTSKPSTTTIRPINFHEDFDYEQNIETTKLTDVNSIYLTTKSPFITTTKKQMSLFEQLFGDYDETVTTTERTKPPALFANLSNNKNKYDGEIKTEKPSFTTPHYPNSHAGPTSLENSYEYEEDYSDEKSGTTSAPVVNETVVVPPQNNQTVENYDVYDYQDKETTTTTSTTPKATTTGTTPPSKVTSLPLGENHVTSLNNRDPIIVATQNLKQKLSGEKVPSAVTFNSKPVLQHAPSTSSIHIPPDQDTVSFVVGNHQNVEGAPGQFVGTSLKESPYESNPFRPVYGSKDSVSYTIQGNAEELKPPPLVEGSTDKPGQVMDDDEDALTLDEDKIEFPKGTGSKIVFPDETSTKEELQGPQPLPPPPPNREVLQLSSQPMYHQLPSDLTPPKEKETPINRPRPPWDPRPGHFYSGKPEYVRPPRPPPEQAYKRIDNLPNILPQFRPNMNTVKHNHPPPPHFYDNRLVRQPLLERPSNRPIGFFEKLQPPPPPPQGFHNLRKIPQPHQSLDEPIAEDRIINEGPKHEGFGFFQSPPKVVVLASRRNGDDDAEVETLQMIQAKSTDKKEATVVSIISAGDPSSTENPLYVVYPVNTQPIKLDVIDSNKKESVVIGTRAELPLPPSKINNKDYTFEQNPIYPIKDRNDSPILKPHPRPSTFPVKSDFPYPLERPDPSVIHPAVPEAPTNNNLDDAVPAANEATSYISSNQWNTIGENQVQSRIVTGTKVGQNANQISVTLKTYTEKPIAVAYTPTEPHQFDKFSLPNYGSPVIPEIRKPGGLVLPEVVDDSSSEFTVSAVMHTHPNTVVGTAYKRPAIIEDVKVLVGDSEPIPNNAPGDFQAPFQASMNVDSSLNQGWSVVRDKNKTTTDVVEVTTMSIATTSEFDIENFKPQLIGGFKPIYSYPEDEQKKLETEVNEREE